MIMTDWNGRARAKDAVVAHPPSCLYKKKAHGMVKRGERRGDRVIDQLIFATLLFYFLFSSSHHRSLT